MGIGVIIKDAGALATLSRSWRGLIMLEEKYCPCHTPESGCMDVQEAVT